jgi:hypothetical protein
MTCDNKNQVHDNLVINETKDGIRVYCKLCKEVNVLRMDLNGRFNNREYQRVMKRDTLQPGSNLYYKVYPNKMSVI